MFSITLLSGLILTGSFVSADDFSVDNISITVTASCTMESTGQNSHNTEIINGTYVDDIGTTTLKAYCNDSNGFAIYAAGYTGDEIGGTNSTKLVGQNTNTTIVTGTATTAGNPDVSNWAMKLGTVTSPTPTYPITIDNGFSSYSEIPSAYTKVAHRDSGTDTGTNAEGSTLTTTYAAYISKTQTADTYNGKVKYTMVHPANETPLQPQSCESGKICYFPNGSNVVGTMGQQSIATSDISATLLASNYSREGYGFAGWNDKFDYTGNFYGPQEDITFTAGQYTGTNNGLALYAVWVKSAGSLQDTSKVATLCGTGTGSLTTAPTDGTANLASVSALTDQRDNQTYAIAKLADGKCWMIENLRLESTNSDNSTGALAQGYGTSATYGNFSGLANAESTGFSSTYSANSLYSNDGSNDTINIGTSYYPAYRMPRYNNLNTQSRASNPTSNSFTYDNTTGGMYSYGNYYTWHAAIADLTYNGTDNSSVTNASLCPAGWHLPTGGSVTTTVNVTETPSTWREFYNLGYGIMGSVANDSNAGTNAYYNNTTTNSNGDTAMKAFRKFPNNFLYSGLFTTSSANNRGYDGRYWSSTVNDYGNSYSLILTSYNVRPGTYNDNKYFGFSIRCTAGI